MEKNTINEREEEEVESADVKVDPNSEHEEAHETKVEKWMNENGRSTGLKISKLHTPGTTRYLKKQPWH